MTSLYKNNRCEIVFAILKLSFMYGKRIGRPQTTKDDIPAVFFKHYPTYASGRMNVSELARVCGLSRPTVYKYLKLVG